MMNGKGMLGGLGNPGGLPGGSGRMGGCGGPGGFGGLGGAGGHGGFGDGGGLGGLGGFGGPGGFAPLEKGVKFTIVNGQVTGMQNVYSTSGATYTHDMALPKNATFVTGTNTVTETLTNPKNTKVLQFAADSGNSGTYHLVSETLTITTPTTTAANGNTSGYSFSISNGSVTGMQTVFGNSWGSHTRNLPMDPVASFVVSGSTVTETTIHGNRLETIQFVTSGTGGLYAIASDSTTLIQQGAATTALSVEPFDRVKFSIDGSGKVTQAQHVLPDGSTVTVTSNGNGNTGSNTSYAQLSAGYVLETVTRGINGNNSRFELFYDSNNDGIYTAIAHGTGTSVDLTGVQAQLSSVHQVVF